MRSSSSEFPIWPREDPEAHCNRGVALARLGRGGEALAAFDQAIAQRPDFAVAHFHRGNLMTALGRLEEAVAALGEAIRLKSDFADAYVNRGAAYALYGNFLAALADADSALSLRAGFDRALILRASAFWKLGRHDEALASADKALALNPKSAAAHAIRAPILADLLRLEEQMQALAAAVRFDKGNADYLHSLGVALSNAGRAREAGEIYAEALRLTPDDPLIHYRSSLIRLFLGDFEDGLAEHEWRLKKPDFVGARYAALAPQWTGAEIAGKSLLVYGEQGLGDAIQFARYLTPLAAKGAKVSLIVPSPIRSLMRSSFDGIEVLSELKGPRFDLQVPLLSLAHVFSTRLDTIPEEVPYLSGDPALIDKWRVRIGTKGFRIGVVWQGNPKQGMDRFRSINPSQFAPLAAIPGVRLISLQAIHGLDKLDALPPEVEIESFGDQIARNPEGMSEIAGLLHSLDLVVSIDSAIVHLAGALARPVFVVLGKQSEWRWMEGRSDSPWYPTMKLFRQANRLAWDDVFAAIARDVKKLVLRAAAGDGGDD